MIRSILDGIPPQKMDADSVELAMEIRGVAGEASMVMRLFGAPTFVVIFCAIPFLPTRSLADSCEVAVLLGSDTASNDHFGGALDVSADRAIVGAPDDNAPLSDAGSAYIWTLTGGSDWIQTAKLVATDAAASDSFGSGVAIDGDTALVGADADDDLGSASGSAYVFVYSDETGWTQQAKLLAGDGAAQAFMGASVALEADLAVAGARGAELAGVNTGAVYVFARTGLVWTEQAKLVGGDSAAGDEFGSDVAIAGDRILVGARRHNDDGGAAYVFAWDGVAWVEEAKLVPTDNGIGDQFGVAVDLEGLRAVIGAKNDTHAAANSGSAYVYERLATTWLQFGKLAASNAAANDLFGSSVFLMGDRILVGATDVNLGSVNSGAAYVFEKQGTIWTETEELLSAGVSTNGDFGAAVAMTDTHYLVSAPEDTGIGSGSGSVFDYFFGIGEDCNGDAIADICDVVEGITPDCNGNQIPDECDVAAGTSQDCSANGVPDECEPDCNANGLADSCDIANGTSQDCGSDGVPDECLRQVVLSDDFSALEPDPDRWPVVAGAVVDHFGVNEPSGTTSLHLNGSADGGDLLESLILDLSWAQMVELTYSYQRTGGLDSPESADDLRVEYRNELGEWVLLQSQLGSGSDATVFTPQSIELPPEAHHSSFALRFLVTSPTEALDDWFIDDLELAYVGVDDCNGNSLPDTCDLALGNSDDCSANGTPDECENDCNGNGVADSCDIAAGLSADCNANGIPDACDLAQRVVGDCDYDGLIDDCDPDGCIARGVTLLSNIPPFEVGASAGNSIWAYVSPSGREYAIMGYDTGTAFIEVTDPADPVLVSLQAGPVSTWRDMKAYDHYSYSVSEGGQGIQVFNLADIDNGIVTFVKNVTTGGTQDTHTLAMNAETGFLYRSGGGEEGIRFYTLANPADPVYVGEWSDRYCHETTVVSYHQGPYAGMEVAFCCGGLNTGYDDTGLYIVDITNKAAPVQLSYYAYPLASYSHQGWPSPDLKYFYLNDEFDEDDYNLLTNSHVIQIEDLSNPIEAATFTNGSSSIDHNLYTLGRFIFESNYTSGLRVFDATDPVAPVEIGHYDTWPQNDAVIYDALWNNYPYLPSGIVIGSDISTGFYAWDVSALRDCNANGFDDGEDIAQGISRDCNTSRIPDECEFDDCNANCIPDDEEINVGAAADDDGDGVPDECAAAPCDGDVNGDGTIDPLDSGYVLSRFGCPVGTGDANCDAADANADGQVDPLDSGYVLSRLGPCD